MAVMERHVATDESARQERYPILALASPHPLRRSACLGRGKGLRLSRRWLAAAGWVGEVERGRGRGRGREEGDPNRQSADRGRTREVWCACLSAACFFGGFFFVGVFVWCGALSAPCCFGVSRVGAGRERGRPGAQAGSRIFAWFRSGTATGGDDAGYKLCADN
jgi:hypothetical protein